jgi:hypothetical protein
MKLNISERLILVNVVPERGNFETMSTVESLTEILYPSEKEVNEFEITQTEEKISWNEKGSAPVEINLSEKQMNFLIKQLEHLSEQGLLNLQQYKLLKKIREK